MRSWRTITDTLARFVARDHHTARQGSNLGRSWMMVGRRCPDRHADNQPNGLATIGVTVDRTVKRRAPHRHAYGVETVGEGGGSPGQSRHGCRTVGEGGARTITTTVYRRWLDRPLPSRQRSAAVRAPAASASRQRRNCVAGGLGVITSPRTVEYIVPYGWGATDTILLDRRKGFERTKRA